MRLGVAGFSWNVLEAAPALVKISIKDSKKTALGAVALQSVSTAMRNGLTEVGGIGSGEMYFERRLYTIKRVADRS